MIKPLKALTTIGAVTAALLTCAPAMADNDAERIWSAPMMKAMDANKDGKVSLAERRTPAVALFDKADSNKDGQLSPAEQQAASRNR